ncbi:citrate:proton symporter [Sphingomonas sp. MG17]|uniref:Citrate:proton symporter n=1 Tax=Sphingomonas tagetis TaxID=2949092 RepID=A0A9X2KKT8_9SPHN|nr:citrate:proton symporter [Sphingomonas tagetis]MCP3729972.1 citrate:proton symporter [Sphingomonas tagetis]
MDGLALLAFAMVATFLALVMTKRLSALIALMVVPTVFALAAGFHAGLGDMMIEGVRNLAPTGVMLLFAILYFSLMMDAGLFDPLVRVIVRTVHGDPVRIAIGTVVLALVVGLDGDGTTTYMICIAALLPLYKHIDMDRRVLACLLIMSCAVMNLSPWGGPTARAATALHVDPGDVFVRLLPAIAASGAWTLFVAWRMGLRERVRLAANPQEPVAKIEQDVLLEEVGGDLSIKRPRLFVPNLLLTLTLLGLLISGLVPLVPLFMIAFAAAAMLNYPNLAEQRARIAAHAANAMATASLVFAAGIFTGILSGTKMVDAMAGTVMYVIPPELGPYLAPVTALISIPFTVFISNDAFYFGMLPIIAKTAALYGIDAADLARASLVGQQIHLLSPLVASTYLLVGQTGVEFGELQRFVWKWALASCGVFMAAALLVGAFPFAA